MISTTQSNETKYNLCFSSIIFLIPFSHTQVHPNSNATEALRNDFRMTIDLIRMEHLVRAALAVATENTPQNSV